MEKSDRPDLFEGVNDLLEVESDHEEEENVLSHMVTFPFEEATGHEQEDGEVSGPLEVANDHEEEVICDEEGNVSDQVKLLLGVVVG